MNIFTRLICTLFQGPPRTAIAANEAAAAESDGIMIAANEAKKDGDWVQISPFGDYPNAVGMQRFLKDDAVNVVNEFSSLLNTPNRLLGLPWYIGHPDFEQLKARYKDTKAYGRIKELQVRDDGLYGRVKFNEDGKKLIESEAFHGHSVNWKMRKDGNVWRPFSLKSVGFTNEPGIPAKPVTAVNETTTNTMDRNKLITKLGLAATATDEQIETAIANLQTTIAANEAVTGQLTEATGKVTTLQGRVTTLETEAANEREERVKLLIGDGIRLGKITKAEEAAWQGKFKKNFTEAANELQAAKPKLSTESKLGNLGRRSADGADRVQQIQDAVNERLKTKGGDYHANFMALKREKPELFKDATTEASA